MAKVSVLIPTRNRAKILETVVNSIMENERVEEILEEILIIDNNSTDNTREAVDQLAAKTGQKVKYLFEKKPGSPCALNTGLRAANGEVISRLDDDCVPDKNWLVNIEQVFSDPQVMIVQGKVIARFETPLPDWMDDQRYYPLFETRARGLENETQGLYEYHVVTGANMLHRKSFFEKVGGFLEITPRTDDTELYYRAKANNIKYFFAPQIVAYHQIVSKRFTPRYLKWWYMVNGIDCGVIRRHYEPVGRTFARIPLWIIRQMAETLVLCLKNFFNPKERVYSLAQLYRLIGLARGYHKKINWDIPKI